MIQSEQSKNKILERFRFKTKSTPVSIPKEEKKTYVPPKPDSYDEDGIPIYKFESKFINGAAAEVFTTYTDKNQYQIKGSTGCGGTTVMLNFNEHPLIIVTPNVINITSIEVQKSKYATNQMLCLYGGCVNNQRDVEAAIDSGAQFTVMTTPDSLMGIKKSNIGLYKKLKKIHLFIDEVHQMVKDVEYRPIMTEFFYEINNPMEPWASYKLSTATPIPEYADIIANIEIIKFIRSVNPTREIYYSEEADAHIDFIRDQLALNRLVIVFSNDSNVYRRIGSNWPDISYFATGDGIGYKIMKNFTNYSTIRPIKEIIEEDEKRIIVCSKALIAGVDFLPKRDTSVCIIVNPRRVTDNFDIIDCKQGIGRVRNNLADVLIVNRGLNKEKTQKKGCNSIKYDPPTTLEMLNNKLKDLPDEKDFDTMVMESKLRLEYQFFNEEARIAEFNRLGLFLIPYEIRGPIEKANVLKFNQQMKNVLLLNKDILSNAIFKMRENIYHKNNGSYGPKDLLLIYAAYLIKKYQPTEILDLLEDWELKDVVFYRTIMDSLLQYRTPEFYTEIVDEIYNPCNACPMVMIPEIVFNVQRTVKNTPSEKEIIDFVLLFCGNYLSREYLQDEIDRHILIEASCNNRKDFWKIYMDLYVKGSDKSKAIQQKCKRYIETDLEAQGIKLNESENEYVNTCLKEILKDFDTDMATYNMNKIKNPKLELPTDIKNYKDYDKIIETIKKACLVIYSSGKGSLIMINGNREYSALTAMSKPTRSIIPIKLEEFDIKEAYPTFINLKFGLPNNEVYEKIMKFYNIERFPAKLKYNTVLNNHRAQWYKTEQFFNKSCGYPKKISESIANWIIDSPKGTTFDEMSALEKEAIEEFIRINEVATQIKEYYFIRFHDAVLVPMYILDPEISFELHNVFHNSNFMLNLQSDKFKFVKFGHKGFNYGEKEKKPVE